MPRDLNFSNRLVRTRLPGGVGGVAELRLGDPIPIIKRGGRFGYENRAVPATHGRRGGSAAYRWVDAVMLAQNSGLARFLVIMMVAVFQVLYEREVRQHADRDYG